MPHGAISLAEFDHPQVEVACNACSRHARLGRARLVRDYGADIALPDLRAKLAAEAGCDRYGSFQRPCGLFFVALVGGNR
jgi:hypothetical protein